MSEAPRLEVLDADAVVSVQDAGRPGYGALGVSVCGAADQLSRRIGNRLLTSADSDAAIEVTLQRLAIGVRGASVRIALTGAACDATAMHADSSRPLPMWRPIELEPGDRLTIRVRRAGQRTYLCVAGGVAVEPVLGSRSAHTATGIGPPLLRVGDRLPIGGKTAQAGGVRVDPDGLTPLIRSLGARTFRVVDGPDAEVLGRDGAAALEGHTFRVDPASNRVGLRLGGRIKATAATGSRPSDAAARGMIQLTPSGGLVVLGPDASPTGGYPVVASVIAADLDALGQAAPGDGMSFRRVDLDDAWRAHADREKMLDAAIPGRDGAVHR